MQLRVLHGMRGAVLVALLAVALVATGFAHRMPSASDLAAQTLVLAGVDLSDICGKAGNDGRLTHPDCPACHIDGSVLVPDAAQGFVDANYAFVARVVAPRQTRAVRAVRDPARGLRAPPLA